MDQETRAAFGRMEEDTKAAFGRMERWCELSQAQRLDDRAYMEDQFSSVRAELSAEISSVRADIAALRSEFHRFRDWATAQIIELRSLITGLTRRFEAMG